MDLRGKANKMSDTVNTLLVFFALMAIGYFLAHAGILDEHASAKITKIVLILCIPATMLTNILAYFDAQMLKGAVPAIGAALATTLAGWFLGWLAARLLRIPSNRRGVFAVLFCASNTVFVGLPVTQALFGGEATVPALLYFLCNTITFWTVGAWGVRMDAGVKVPFFSLASLRALCSPSLVMLVAALALVYMEIQPPAFVLRTAEYLGAPGTPLAMLVAGGVICRGVARGTWKRGEVIYTMIGKVFVMPLLAFAFTRLLDVDGFVSSVFVTQAAMPVMSQSTILAQDCGADDELASAATVVSMLSLLIVMPVCGALFA